MNDFTNTWDNMNLRQRIAHLLADWKQSKDTTDPMVLRVAATMAHHQLEEADAEIEQLREQLRLANIDCFNTTAEVDRLRTQLEMWQDGNIMAESHRDELEQNADEFANTLTELRQRVETLTNERDEARESYCLLMEAYRGGDGRVTANKLGWGYLFAKDSK